MGDQKDHMTIQKKDVDHASADVDVQDFEMATESQAPPALQLKASAEGGEAEESLETASEMDGAFQFAADAPVDPEDSDQSKVFSNESIQGKGIAEPFKMPIVQKKETTVSKNEPQTEKPSFTL